jgi:hypothetical protein
MMWKELATAAVFYMPFVVTIAFGLFVFCIGLVALMSGTMMIILLAAYGLYSVIRDLGVVKRAGELLQTGWTSTSETVVENLRTSFVLEGTETLPTGPALYVCAPHGVVGYSWFLHFSYALSAWPKDISRPVLAIHSIFFRIPFARDVLAANRCIEATEEEITTTLKSGQSVALIIGGVEEMTYAGQETVKVVLKKRKGYSRIAVNAKVPVVMVYTDGENELFGAESNRIWMLFSTWMYRLTNLQFPLPSWTSLKRFGEILHAPLDPPVRTICLPPIESHRKDEASIRKECVAQLTAFFQAKSIQASVIA